MDVTNHWRYFLSLEADLDNTLRFVEYTKEHEKVFSFEYARLLLLSCSEIDTLFKVVCDHMDPMSNVNKIGEYWKPISDKYCIESEIVEISRYSLDIQPFKDWSEKKPPNWWTSNNMIKHRRHEEFRQANLGNSMHAMAGLFVLNLVALHEFGLLKSVSENPIFLRREKSPGNWALEQGYEVCLKIT